MIIDGATYHRLAQAARFQPKEAREHDIQESKLHRDSVEVGFYFDYYCFFKLTFKIIEILIYSI